MKVTTQFTVEREGHYLHHNGHQSGCGEYRRSVEVSADVGEDEVEQVYTVNGFASEVELSDTERENAEDALIEVYRDGGSLR